MADDVIAFARACFRAGVDGFFLTSQFSTRTALPERVYERLGVPFDLKVLEALRPESSILILHLHELEPLFDLADRYSIDAVNRHYRDTYPTLAEALSLTRRGLVGGIARLGTVAKGRAGEAAAEVRDALAQTGRRWLIVGPGRVVPFATPMENLLAACRAVEAQSAGGLNHEDTKRTKNQ